MSHIVIFDIGRTNKKLFVFDEQYRIMFERSECLPETKDEDGDPCEDVRLLSDWVRSSWNEVLQMPDFQVKAVNFSAYGASFVYLDEDGKILTPLYNYLKPYPGKLKQQFYEKYGGEESLASETASPVLDSLNSGMQLYRLKYEQLLVFQKIKYALHLPQFISWLISGKYYSDLTSIGCHTNLWDFAKNDYHDWVMKEELLRMFPPNKTISILNENSVVIGTGLHDSSAALIPYMASTDESFLLLSTGTWNIALNPWNNAPLTYAELMQDCLCYLSWKGNPVKASRLFAGHEHQEMVKNLGLDGAELLDDTNEAYFVFMEQLVDKQVVAINLVLSDFPVNRIFVDGGFSKNAIFMALLKKAFPALEVYAAVVAQASALGAAIAIHDYWNEKPLPKNIIKTI